MERTSSESSTGCSDDSAPYADVESGSRQGLLTPPPPYNYDAKSGATATATPGRPSTRTIAFAALGISSVCFILVAVGVVVVVFCRGLGPDDVHGYAEVCLPCEQVLPNPLAHTPSPLLDVLEVRHDRLKDGGSDSQICCACTPPQYAALFKLILKRQEEVKKLADVMGSTDRELSLDGDVQHNFTVPPRAVAAHLVFKPPTGGSNPTVQRWKSGDESPLSYVRDGLKFEDNTIYVLTPGLYFIYCQVLYNADTPLGPSSSVTSYVLRHSLAHPPSSGILLKTRHTRYDKEVDRHSSYVGGLVFLRKGDQLYVKVSVPELVSYDDKGSFFGLFKVGD